MSHFSRTVLSLRSHSSAVNAGELCHLSGTALLPQWENFAAEVGKRFHRGGCGTAMEPLWNRN
ncbi:MAG: hypothetical protein IJ901_04205 [Bacteroidaceae bacterium]|nr:hypothetical protein [Bacteroidaceae bacterium]